jgi:hypothetical protein
MSAMKRIDVHSHVVLPSYRKGIEASRLSGYGKPDGIPKLPVCYLCVLFQKETVVDKTKTGI